jgi:hypothetical protein
MILYTFFVTKKNSSGSRTGFIVFTEIIQRFCAKTYAAMNTIETGTAIVKLLALDPTFCIERRG